MVCPPPVAAPRKSAGNFFKPKRRPYETRKRDYPGSADLLMTGDQFAAFILLNSVRRPDHNKEDSSKSDLLRPSATRRFRSDTPRTPGRQAIRQSSVRKPEPTTLR